MLSGVKFLLDFLWFTLHCTVRWEFSLVDMSGYNHPIRRKRYSESKRKNYWRLGVLFRKSTIYAGQICPPYLAVTTDNWKIRRQCPTWPTYFVHTGKGPLPYFGLMCFFLQKLNENKVYMYVTSNYTICKLKENTSTYWIPHSFHTLYNSYYTLNLRPNYILPCAVTLYVGVPRCIFQEDIINILKQSCKSIYHINANI